MREITVSDAALRKAAEEGMDTFIGVFTDALHQAVGEELTTATIQELNADQVTLMAWETLHREVMDGGFVQLIHNGYGPFIFKNPFAKALNKLWHMRELSKMVYEAHTLYAKYGAEIEKDCTDEEFMMLFERFPEFEDLDDQFVENEEEYTAQVAGYIDENIQKFASIVA
jgi:hypothetical protein